MKRANDEGPTVAAATPQEQTQSDGAILPQVDDPRKALAVLRAHAALCGCGLHELSSGGYLLTRWGLAKELPDLRAVGDLLRRIGGAR